MKVSGQPHAPAASLPLLVEWEQAEWGLAPIWTFLEETNFLPMLGFELRIILPVAYSLLPFSIVE
jgi:hypothetical protein